MIEASLQIGMREACVVLGVSPASIYRDLEPVSVIPAVKLVTPSPRALVPGERTAVLEALNSDEFADKSPAQIFHTLLDRGQYLASVRTMYRVLGSVMAVIERRAVARHPHHPAPQLLATAPNQVWSWDITKLKAAGHFLCLYVILDIFSRYVVGWMLASRESARIASVLIEETFRRHGIKPGTLILHSDRGSPMTAGTTYELLHRLEIEPSHSRPRVSDERAAWPRATIPSLRPSSRPSSIRQGFQTNSADPTMPSLIRAGSLAGTTTSITTRPSVTSRRPRSISASRVLSSTSARSPWPALSNSTPIASSRASRFPKCRNPWFGSTGPRIRPPQFPQDRSS